MATIKPGRDPITQELTNVDSLGGAGSIAFDETSVESVGTKRKDIEDYIRARLGDGMVDVELDPDHYRIAINQALNRYRQRASGGLEESYAFLGLLPETQEYILPPEIQEVRAVYRRGIGSVTGTTASQFEPFAAGFLNTYMLVAGRVGGLVNYELFSAYQKQAMKMFGGFMNFTWNRASRKLTIVRKIPDAGHRFVRVHSITSNGLVAGSVITIVTEDAFVGLAAGDSVIIRNCVVSGYNGSYAVQTIDGNLTTITLAANGPLAANSVTGFDLRKTEVFSPVTDDPSETVLLWCYNVKPDSMILNDYMIFNWIQDYSLALCKDMLGQAREKFAQIAGPQGGTQLNGAALKAEAKVEMGELEEELKRFYDGSMPLAWVTG